MATRALPAFDTKNHKAKNAHKRLLDASAVIDDDVQLAAMFGCSVPTVRKWRRLPLGYQPGVSGRPKKKATPLAQVMAPDQTQASAQIHVDSIHQADAS